MLRFLMNIKVLDNLVEVEAIQTRWNELANDCPLHSWEWMVSWWETFCEDNQLAVLACRDDKGSLVGIAPWHIDTESMGRVIRSLGSGKVCTDYTRILAGPAESAAVCDSIVDFLRRAIDGEVDFRLGRVHGVELDGVAIDSPESEYLSASFASQGFQLTDRPTENSWRVSLEDGWDGLLKSMSSNWRRKARKAAKRLDSGQVSFHSTSDANEFAVAFEKFVDLHQRRRKMLSEDGCFADPRFESFLSLASERLLKRDACRIQWCEHQGNMIVAQFQLLSESTVYMYQSGMDPDALSLEPGHTILAGAIRSAIDEGRTCYDFLRGDEPYKAGWQGKPVSLSTVRYVSPILAARVSNAVTSTARHAKKLVRGWIN